MKQAAWKIGWVVVLCLAFVTASRAEEAPVGGISFHERSFAAGIGYSWGAGTLHYEGKNYPFKVTGLAVGQVGAEDITAVGGVHYMKKVSDFAGNYTAMASDVALGGGEGGIVMKNANGVVIVVHATTRGVDAQIATEGLKITLE